MHGSGPVDTKATSHSSAALQPEALLKSITIEEADAVNLIMETLQPHAGKNVWQYFAYDTDTFDNVSFVAAAEHLFIREAGLRAEGNEAPQAFTASLRNVLHNNSNIKTIHVEGCYADYTIAQIKAALSQDGAVINPQHLVPSGDSFFDTQFHTQYPQEPSVVGKELLLPNIAHVQATILGAFTLTGLVGAYHFRGTKLGGGLAAATLAANVFNSFTYRLISPLAEALAPLVGKIGDWRGVISTSARLVASVFAQLVAINYVVRPLASRISYLQGPLQTVATLDVRVRCLALVLVSLGYVALRR